MSFWTNYDANSLHSPRARETYAYFSMYLPEGKCLILFPARNKMYSVSSGYSSCSKPVLVCAYSVTTTGKKNNRCGYYLFRILLSFLDICKF